VMGGFPKFVSGFISPFSKEKGKGGPPLSPFFV